MRCTIYALGELKKKRRISCERVLVLARYKEGLVLCRDEINALWILPQQKLERGEDEEESARSALGKCLGEAVYDMRLLCEFSVLLDDGKESGGRVYLADVQEWPDVRESAARTFTRMPLGSQVSQAALVFGLYRWAGEFFDERLDIALLGQPAAL